jgi:putative addiction module component (TIGR02574 family)
VRNNRAHTVAATPIADLLQLPRDERLALAMTLWDSLDDEGRSEALPVDPDLCTELDRRWAAHQQNPSAALPWDEVQHQLGLG